MASFLALRRWFLLQVALILLLALVPATTPATIQAPALSIRGKSFALATSLHVLDQDGDSFKYEIDEAYSAKESRSAISFRTMGARATWQKRDDVPTVGTFYIDNYNTLLVDDIKRTCVRSSLATITNLFHLNPLDVERNDQRELYIAGPARLLLFLDSYRQQMERSEDLGMTIRNVPSVMYTLGNHKELPLMGPVRFSIFYKSESNGSISDQFQVPLQVVIEIENEKQLFYDFLNIETLKSGEQSMNRLEDTLDDRAKFDRFAVEPGIGCGQHLVSNAEETLYLDSMQLQSFSFKAEVTRQGFNQKMDVNVAFQSSISALRVDKAPLMARATTSLADYQLGRIYHIQGHLDVHESTQGRRIELSEKEEQQVDCVVAESQSLAEMATNVGELLLGATGFLYLGKARVRGIDVRAYEAHNSKWPVWLQQPTVYYKWESNKRLRSIRPTNQGQDYPLNTLIFVAVPDDESHHEEEAADSNNKIDANVEKSKNAIQRGRLVHMDICVLGMHSSCISKTSISIFDFAWQVNVHSGSANRPDQYFSLADLCPASELDDNHYGRVDMLAHGSTSSSGDGSLLWLQSQVAERNLAFMAMLQSQFELPISMIYDLETRVSSSPVPTEPVALAASFRLAEHDRKLAYLIFVGHSSIDDFHLITRGLIVLQSPFESCAFMARHRKRRTQFAYVPNINRCIIDARIDLSPDEREPASIFQLSHDGSMEIYETSHEEDTTLSIYDQLTSLAHRPDRLRFLNDDKKNKFKLYHNEKANDYLQFKIKALDVDELSEKSPFQVDNVHLPDTNKFLGFGLVRSDKWNKQIISDPLNSFSDNSKVNQKTEMSFGQCRSACLQDFDCNSFSICIKGLDVECILSSVSFRDPSLVAQFMANEGKPQSTQTILVRLDETTNQTIQLTKRANCELHNKIYTDLFERTPGQMSLSMKRRRLYPVSGREQCAQMCLNRTLTLLRRDVAPTNQQLISSLIDNPSNDPQSIQEAVRNHQKLFSYICDSFFYVDKLKLQSKDNNASIERQVEPADSTRRSDGYCLIPGDLMRPTENDPADNNNGLNERVDLERYSFKFSSLYERQYGIRLRESTEVEYLVNQHLPITKDNLKREDLLIIKSFIDRGYNAQVVTYKDELACSLMCFGQSIGLWPACKSFDIVVKKVHDQQISICLLNTITLLEAIKSERFELIDGELGDNLQVWHFEPLAGFVLAETNQQSRYWFAGLQSLMSIQSLLDGSKMGPFSSMLLITIALVAGVVLGVKLGSTYLIRSAANLGQSADDPTNQLVDNRPTVEFSNLVNFEGKICAIEEEDEGREH